MITFHIVSLFPESLDSYLGVSILKRAQDEGRIALKYYNPRDYVVSRKHPPTYADRRVDDRPYGGGPGMVLQAEPVVRAIARAIGRKLAKPNTKKKVKIIFFSPAGRQFSNELADTFQKYSDIVLVCGRYEGIDARVKKVFPMVDISVGPYVLTGGELGAMIMIDTITRRLPGVLGHDESVEERRVASPDVYTRPAAFKYKKKIYKVPEVLRQGHHAKIEQWKVGRQKVPVTKRQG